jgi:glycosyltransferase involved in cell wall biosynthesis
MPQAVFVVAGSLENRTGGSIYNRRMAEAVERLGWSVDVYELDESFPRPTDAAISRAGELLAEVPQDTITVVDGLAYGAMPQVAAQEGTRLRLMPIVHLPLAAAPGLEAHDVARFAQAERQALAHARRVIITGAETRSLMERFGLVHQDVALVEPGTDPAPLAQGSRANASSRSASPRVQLLSVAALTPGKGHEILIDALATLPHRAWHLVCAGSLTRDGATAARVRESISRANLDDHVTLAGDHLAAAYDGANVVVLASLQETYGMAVAEALARGLPVVATATGAIPDLVGDGAGLVVPPGDGHALAAALSRMICDSSLRTRCAEGARRTRARLRSWDEAGRQFARALAA